VTLTSTLPPIPIHEALELLLSGHTIPVSHVGRGRYSNAQPTRVLLRSEVERSGHYLHLCFDAAKGLICFKAVGV
jgi:hypothetical protein